MATTRVKICGITRIEDALAAVNAGADAIGLVFYDASPRCVDLETAKAIAIAAGPFVTLVALFVNPTAAEVNKVLSQLDPDVLQFHGDEDEAFCSQFNRRYLKAIRMAEGIDPGAETAKFPSASGFLFDAWNRDKYGGTGETFDWGRVPQGEIFPVVLAGGLNPGNVADAVSRVKPYAVDVSGGVESAPGVKSADQILHFIVNAKAVTL